MISLEASPKAFRGRDTEASNKDYFSNNNSNIFAFLNSNNTAHTNNGSLMTINKNNSNEILFFLFYYG